VLRRIFGPKGRKRQGDGENRVIRDIINCNPRQIFWNDAVRSGWKGHVTRVGKMREACNIFGQNPKERDHLENLGIEGG
jgi:hypothetical protein